ncbi:MAG: Rv3654c family TadE-like protein [Segniliparus sp.]|uniref:Rv3654c family TadE-like protein n=1 Tax=Segniliparus sp. TaxID=2804064 RepID=UPI003F36C8AA
MTVASAFVIATLVAFTVLLSWAGAAVSARHRAQAAADLAALAGAYRALDGEAAACAAARAFAGRSAGRLVSCQTVDLDVLVVVEVDTAAPGFASGPARATARAGPAPVTSALSP